MVEFVGQTLHNNGKSYFDIVPSIQFIIFSQARIDVAYRQELYSSMLRSAPNGFYLNLEYTFSMCQNEICKRFIKLVIQNIIHQKCCK